MSNLGRLFRVFLLSSFLVAATTASPTFQNHTEFEHSNHNITNSTNLEGLECDSCQFITHKIDDFVFHNEKVMEFVQNEFDNICNLLPDDAKNICYSKVNQTLPNILASIGDFIATNGCEEIGICPT
jgi:hypothetical protein